MTTKYTIGIFGDGGVGKTAFVRALKQKKFNPQYLPTSWYEVHSIDKTKNVRDYAGQDKYRLLPQDMSNVTSAILMYDVTNPITYKNLEYWYNLVKTQCGDIPMILLGNKVDIKDRRVFKNMIEFHKNNNLPYYEISTKTGFNMDKMIEKINN
uniref:Uncharacterized protein n=1 Tax=viral metagenome TaxID=1070528 RepID=A0A6C0JP59_9ZZZZ